MEPAADRDRAADVEMAELEAKLATYPVSRYPVQHATAAFGLATVHLHRGQLDEAVPLLATAYEIFGRVGMRLEQSKALTMHGIALREAGRSGLAVETFARAARAFHDLDQPTEEAAASYNLGLAQHEHGDSAAAQVALALAYELFLAAGHLAQAGAAARERGTYLLTTGEIDAAVAALDEAATLAHRAGDLPGLGAAANALGLAHLAAGEAAAAVREFSRAVGAYPRSLRAPEHAMVKANLAVAFERVGNQPRARLAARQSLAIATADQPVREQARLLLDRLSGDAQVDLLSVLDEEPAERWSATLREEVLRWCEAPRPERLIAVRGFLDGLIARPGTAYELAESLISVLVELPPPPYAEMVASIVRVTDDLEPQDVDRVHSVVGSAMARFAIPQWQRLVGSLNAAEAAAGRPGGWR
ncbi:MAG: tetratricopeptide repeat protein [Nocardioides sp.]|nr:tetratricopeptide repeat protein [Nocardioides sp.]